MRAVGPIEHIWHDLEDVLRLPDPPASRWHRAGVSARGERVLNVVGGFVLLLFTAGWTWSIVHERVTADAENPRVTRSVASALTQAEGVSAAYLTQAVLQTLVPLRGESGKLRAHIQPAGATVADSLPTGASLEYHGIGADSAAGAAAASPGGSGVWRMAVRVGNALRPVADLSVITMRPFTDKRGGRIGLYFIGSWPGERGRVARTSRGAQYDLPAGFIEVTRDNQDTYVSEHFRLRDFLTKDQHDVWPKYLVLRPELIDKLELVLSDLASRGIAVHEVRVLSGFRTPRYNTSGGDPRGRASLSRHMYGDAADIFLDANGDGRMDDLDRNGRVDLRDARVIEEAVERVERAHPRLLGGAGVYPATGAHGPFIHIDTRGYRARWVGSGDD